MTPLTPLGKGRISGALRCGRYAYRKAVIHTTNPDHLVSSASPTGPPLAVASQYVSGRPKLL
jgi:hypothetical protein